MDRTELIVFYDGDCGLCHSFVYFVLLKSKPNLPLFFAPIGGKTYSEATKQLDFSAYSQLKFFRKEMESLPNSIILYRKETKAPLFKGKAVIHILSHLKWPWSGFGVILGKIPISIVDFFYDCIAKIRHKLFQKPTNVCPIVPPEWRKYFKE